MPCVIFDNLNACFSEQVVPGNVKGDFWVGLRSNVEWPHISELMDLMVANFRSAIYVCTASSECWQISPASRRPAYDLNAKQVRSMARDKGLTFWTGESFWNDLAPYKQPHNAYHHGEPGNFVNITYLWDRSLFHIHHYCLTNNVSQRALAS
eukprot:11011716-Heterocapsa_arctica.AAC.1